MKDCEISAATAKWFAIFGAVIISIMIICHAVNTHTKYLDLKSQREVKACIKMSCAGIPSALIHRTHPHLMPKGN